MTTMATSIRLRLLFETTKLLGRDASKKSAFDAVNKMIQQIIISLHFLWSSLFFKMHSEDIHLGRIRSGETFHPAAKITEE